MLMWRRPGTRVITATPLILSCTVLFLAPYRQNTSSVKLSPATPAEKSIQSTVLRYAIQQRTYFGHMQPLCFMVLTTNPADAGPIRAQGRQGGLTHILCLIATEEARDGALVL